MQVPGDVLADVAHALVLAEMVAQQGAVPADYVGDLAQVGRGRCRATAELRGQLGEQPGPAQTAASDDDTVAPGLCHHRPGVGGFEDIAVAQHRDPRDGFFEFGDPGPVGRPRVALGRGPGVQRHRSRTLLLGDASRVEVGVVGVVDADPELHRHGDPGAFGGPDGGGDDLAEEPAFIRQGRTTPASGDLGHGAAEVHIDVVGEVLLDDHPRRGEGGLRVDGVELQRAGRLIRAEGRHVHGHRVAFHQSPRGDHLAHVQATDRAGPGQFELPAQGPERDVGHPGHGRQDNRAAQGQRPDAQPG